MAMLAREQFAVSLRRQKKKEILIQRRKNLLKFQRENFLRMRGDRIGGASEEKTDGHNLETATPA